MRLARSHSAVLVALAIAGCGGGDEAVTEETTRALLTQPSAGGPSTDITGTPDIVENWTPVSVPEIGYNRGDANAPLKVIEFSDFGCGYCRRFHEESFATLKTEFIDSGMIEWKFLSFVSGMFPNSLAATEGAECALEQDAPTYEALGGMLWVRQAEWKGSAEPEAMVRSWAAELGVDMAEYDACLAEDRRMDRIAAATAAAQQLGVRGTPTFWVLGYGPLQGALPLDAFRGIFSTLHSDVVAGAAN